MRYTASHCNTLRHKKTGTYIYMHLIFVEGVPATLCNTLQRTATHCDTLPIHIYRYICICVFDRRVFLVFHRAFAVCCSVLQCVAVCCRVLQGVAGCHIPCFSQGCFDGVEVFGSVLQCHTVAVCRRVSNFVYFIGLF